MVGEGRLRVSQSAIRLACEIVRRGILTKEELNAILGSGEAPREVVTAVQEVLRGKRRRGAQNNSVSE